MSVLTWTTHHRFWALGAVSAVLVVAVAAGVWFFVFRSPGTQIDLRQALRLYRHDQRAPTSTAGALAAGARGLRLPDVGLRAAQRGVDQPFVPVVLGDGRHRRLLHHRAMGAVRAAHRGAGGVPGPERRRGDGLGPVRRGDRRGALDRGHPLSGGAPTSSRPDPTPGLRWTAVCHTGGNEVAFAGHVLGWSSVTVAGHPRAALHTRLTLTFNGSEVGTNPTDYWVSPSDGLILQEREEVNLSQGSGPLGSVEYREKMTVALSSMVAAR